MIMNTASAASPSAPYLSNLAHAVKDLFRAVFLVKSSDLGVRLVQGLRRSAALDAGEKL
jgi:hypothetical protein